MRDDFEQAGTDTPSQELFIYEDRVRFYRDRKAAMAIYKTADPATEARVYNDLLKQRMSSDRQPN